MVVGVIGDALYETKDVSNRFRHITLTRLLRKPPKASEFSTPQEFQAVTARLQQLKQELEHRSLEPGLVLDLINDVKKSRFPLALAHPSDTKGDVTIDSLKADAALIPTATESRRLVFRSLMDWFGKLAGPTPLSNAAPAAVVSPAASAAAPAS